MPTEADFLRQLQANPDDRLLRQIFADWLEEQNDPRGELLRLTEILTRSLEVPDRPRLECRLQELLEDGIEPIGPYWTNDLGMRFAWIPAGANLMGSPPNEEGRRFDEAQHPVSFSRGFYLSVCPVTQEVWKAVMDKNPGYHGGQENLPVDFVSWFDCQEFLRILRSRDGNQYRLPHEAEWEYACRAGTRTPFSFGPTLLPRQANFSRFWRQQDGNPVADSPMVPQGTTPVGTFGPNAFGLFDMHGNVSEWCEDLESDLYGQISRMTEGSNSGFVRVVRGGSWNCSLDCCRCACRHRADPALISNEIGLRVYLPWSTSVAAGTAS